MTAAKSAEELQELELFLAYYTVPEFEAWARFFFPDYIQHSTSRLHRYLIDIQQAQHVERGQKNAVVAPRGGAKTTWTTKLYALYSLCHGLEPYTLLISATEDQAKKNLHAIQDQLRTNHKLRQYYPEVCGTGPTWNKTEMETRNGYRVEAMGAGSARRGTTFGSFRPSLIMVDDLLTDDGAKSKIQRDAMSEWFLNAIIPMGDAETNVMFVGTALHQDDTLQRLRAVGGWTFRTFKSLIKEPTRTDLWDHWKRLFCDPFDPQRHLTAKKFYLKNEREMLEGADVLWPEKESLLDLYVLRNTAGETSFQAEKQGDPSAKSFSEWPSDYFPENIWFDRWPEMIRLKVISLDPSKGKSDTSDYSAFIMLGLGADGNLYVDADLERRDTTRIVEDGLLLQMAFGAHLFVIESNQFQELLADEFDRQSTARCVDVPLAKVDNVINKETRIRTLGPYIRNGKLRFRRNSTGAAKLVAQLKDFPNGGHDDGPDALEMAISGLRHLMGKPKVPIQEEQWDV